MEDWNSMGATAALQAWQALDLARQVVAIELLCAAQALEQHRPLRSGQGVEAAYERVRAHIPPLLADRPPAPGYRRAGGFDRGGGVRGGLESRDWSNPMDILDNIRESIYIHVWSGFYDQAEVEEIILEAVREEQALSLDDDATENDTIDEDAIKSLVQAEFAQKQAAEQTWPKQTDCDRPDLVLNTLNTIGILALQNAGYTV